MRRVVISAGRRGLATLVLVLAGIAAVDAALFKVWHPIWEAPTRQPIHIDCSRSLCYATRPGWTIPVAIVVSILGILVAALIYRPRATTR
jgi:hypothetical protein